KMEELCDKMAINPCATDFGIDVYVMFAMGRRGRRPLPTDQSTLQTTIYRSVCENKKRPSGRFLL
ncbi:MAG: hypothetical protein IKL24_06980, partial [Clostridia bacterium]|nr:hypothetical protein [Clostridia bacterium]